MGFFDDMRRARRAGNEIAAQQGRPTTVAGRIGAIPGDVRYARESAEWAADQQARANVTDGPVPDGVLGVGTLVTYRATGQLDGFQPVSELTLDVEADGWGPHRVITMLRVPYEALVLMTPGRRLRVSFDLKDPTRLAVDWSATDV